MSSPDVLSQYNLFVKYWEKGVKEKKKLNDLKTANSIREKTVNGIDAMVGENNKVDIG